MYNTGSVTLAASGNIRFMPTPNEIQAVKDKAQQFAEGIAAAAAPDFAITARIASEEPEGVVLAFEGEDATRFVGKNGQILDALGFLASQVVNRRGAARIRILFDADDYRRKREETLVKLATELGEQVLATGQEAVLDPLSPMERRIIHNVVSEMPGLQTYSEGEEPERFIIISPA